MSSMHDMYHVSYIVVDVSMFFVLTRRVNKRECEKFCIRRILCVQFSKNDSSDKACVRAQRSEIQNSQFPEIASRQTKHITRILDLHW